MVQKVIGDFLSPESVVRAAGIGEGMKIADFHAASGFFARAAARIVGAGGEVWAVDANRDMLARLKNIAELEGLENVEIVRGNIEKRGGTLLPDNHLDFVLLANALFTCENKEGAIEEAWRVLKDNGKLLVVDWKASFGGLGPHPSHIITMDAAKKLFLRGGFALLSEIPAGEYHWGLLLRRLGTDQH